jgi:hypothetical protein
LTLPAALAGEATQQRSLSAATNEPLEQFRRAHQVLTSQGQAVAAASLNEVWRVVRFEVGRTRLRAGDRITIEEVSGTSDTITAGNIYVVKGTYKLTSAKRAVIAAYTTASAQDGKAMQMQSIPDMKTQRVVVDKGEGRFKLIFYTWYNGNPHVSFYPTEEGSDFGGVYFGTGDSVLREKRSNR